MTLQRRGWAVRSLAVRAFRVAAAVSNALMALPNRIIPPPFRLMQIGSMFWQSRALAVAARLDLATVLADRRLAASDLAVEVGVHPQALRRLMRMLASVGVFEEAAPGTYRNNKLSGPLRADRPDNVRAVVMMHNAPEMSIPWLDHLEDGIRTGASPFELAHGTGLFDFMDEHAAFDALFAAAMDRVEALSGDSFARDFDWSGFSRIIDLGGSKGSKSLAILKRHPHLTALVVDRPRTIAAASADWAGRDGAECLGRMQFMAGDVFSAVPIAESGDVYLLSAVLHAFDDEACARILTTVARAAAGTDAPIVLLELVMPDIRADLTAASFDMQMFVGTRGRERTRQEWARVFDRGGVVLSEIVKLASFATMLVLRAKP